MRLLPDKALRKTTKKSVNVVDVPSKFLPKHLPLKRRTIKRQSQLAFSLIYINSEISLIKFLKEVYLIHRINVLVN
jgi:hypothetical protein